MSEHTIRRVAESADAVARVAQDIVWHRPQAGGMDRLEVAIRAAENAFATLRREMAARAMSMTEVPS